MCFGMLLDPLEHIGCGNHWGAAWVTGGPENTVRTLRNYTFRRLVWAMVTSTDNAHMAKLADTLWYERRLLEYLLFKLVSANLVLIADDRRFVGPAIAEVDVVMTEIRRAEEQRGTVVEAVARQWNALPSAVSLALLVEKAPESLRATFEDHRVVFQELVNEIEVLTRENRRLATVGLDGIQGTLGFAGGDIYDSAGRATRTPDHPIKVNRVL
jgi:hypothetical protein